MIWQAILLNAVFAAAFFAAGWYAHKRSIRLPYRWKCPHDGCEASAGSTDMADLDQVVNAHIRAVHQ